MKKLALLGLLILGGVAGYLLWSQSSQTESVAQNKITSKSPSSSRKVFLGARKNKISKSQMSSDQKLDGCEDLTSHLESLDFNAPVTEWVEGFDRKAFGKCQLPSFKERMSQLQKDCFDEYQEAQCATHAIFLRASLRTRGLDDGEDLEILADLVIREFADNKPDFKKLRKLSDKLLLIDPDQKSYQKLWASSEVVAKLYEGKSAMEVADLVNDRVSPDLWNDPTLSGVKLAMATGLEPLNVESFARGYLAEKSDSSMHEVLGWSLWKQNRKNEAIAELNKAIAMSPKDQWLKDQLKKVQSRNADSESYQARIQLGVNLGDLYN